jgi:hypothetical protein
MIACPRSTVFRNEFGLQNLLCQLLKTRLGNFLASSLSRPGVSRANDTANLKRSDVVQNSPFLRSLRAVPRFRGSV